MEEEAEEGDEGSEACGEVFDGEEHDWPFWCEPLRYEEQLETEDSKGV